MRMSLFTALVSGAQAAENLAAILKGKPPKPLSFVWWGSGIALGPRDAVGFGTYPADVAWPLIFRGMSALRVRNFFVWYLGAALELERRIPGSFLWTGKRRYTRQQRRLGRQTKVAAHISSPRSAMAFEVGSPIGHDEETALIGEQGIRQTYRATGARSGHYDVTDRIGEGG